MVQEVLYISMCEPGYSGLLWAYFLSVLISPFNIIYYFWSNISKDTQQIQWQSLQSLSLLWFPRKMRPRSSCFSLWGRKRLLGRLALLTLTFMCSPVFYKKTHFWHGQKRWICWAGCSWPGMTLPHTLLLLVQLCPVGDWQEVKWCLNWFSRTRMMWINITLIKTACSTSSDVFIFSSSCSSVSSCSSFSSTGASPSGETGKHKISDT